MQKDLFCLMVSGEFQCTMKMDKEHDGIHGVSER